MRKIITDEEMEKFARARVSKTDSGGQFSGENFNYAYAYGVLLSTVTIALNNHRGISELRREIKKANQP